MADSGRIRASDDAIRAYAAEIAAVIVTKDEDFAIHRLLHHGPAVVWIRIGNTRRSELLRRVETELATIVAALEHGEAIIEIA